MAQDKKSCAVSTYFLDLSEQLVPQAPHAPQFPPQEQELLPCFLLRIDFIMIKAKIIAIIEPIITVGKFIKNSPYLRVVFTFKVSSLYLFLRNKRYNIITKTIVATIVPKILPPATVNQEPN